MPDPNPNTSPDQTAAASSIPPQPSMTATSAETSDGSSSSAGGAIPTNIGQYVLLSELGRGGMGVVYRAEDPHLKREIAIKLMLPQFASNPVAKARFVREARAQAKVEHDHVAAIFQVAEHAGLPYLVMPLLKGMTLHAALRANPRPPLPEVIRIGRETAEGLAAAHEKGLVHRDIKPANIWLEGKKLRVKVLDFGLARATDSEMTEADGGPITHEGAIVGTPTYMSPEQARGDALDGRTDLWSVGIMLYQMLTGELPFNGPNTMAILARLAMDNPPPPITKNPAVPPALSDLIMRLLAKNPAYRTPTAELLAEELRAIEAGFVNAVRVIPLDAPPPLIVAAEGPDPFANLDATETSGIVEEQEAEEQAKPKQTERVYSRAPKRGRGIPVWAIAGGVLLGVALIVGIVASQMGKKPQEVVKDDPPPPPPKKEPKKDTLPADHERAAAELLNRYFRLILRHGAPERDVHVQPGQPLPNEPFKVVGVYRSTNDPAPPADVAARIIPAVLELGFLGEFVDVGFELHWSDEQLTRLAANPAMREKLHTFQADFDPSPKAWGALRQLPLSNQLGIRGDRITDDMVAGLPQLGEIERLEIWNLGKSGNLTAKGWAGLLNARRIGSLGFWEPHGVNSEVGKILVGVPGLYALIIRQCELDAATIDELSRCSNLRVLNLFESTVPVSGLQQLTRLKLLYDLGLVRTKLSPEAIESLATLKPLRHLGLQETSVTLEQLKKLNAALPRCTIDSDKGTLEPSEPHFREAQRWVGIGGGTTIKLASGNALEAGPGANFPEEPFTITGLSYGHILGDDNLKGFSAIPTLTKVNIANSGLTAKGLRALLSSRESLTDLTLMNTPTPITSEMLEVIGEFTNLRTLDLRNTPPNVDWKPLAKLTKLQSLRLQGTHLTDEGLNHITGLTNLVELHVLGTPISDAGVETLAGMKQLTTLGIQSTRITKAGYEKLKAALPKCNIAWEDPTRAILARLLGRGVMFRCRLPDNSLIEVTKPEALPPGPFTIEVIGIDGDFGDADILWLEPLASFPVHEIALGGGHKVTAAGLRSLLAFEKTLTHHSYHAAITEEDAKVIARLSRLEFLRVGGERTKLTPAITAHLAQLPRLQAIMLDGAEIADGALANFARTKTLTSIDLSGSTASDAGVEQLAAMQQLTGLNLVGTRVSKAGFEKLKAALPKCAIQWEEPTRAIVTRLMARGCTFTLRLPDGKSIDVSKLEDLPPGSFAVATISTRGGFGDSDMLWLESLANPHLRNVSFYEGHKVTAVGLRSLLPHKDTLKGLGLCGTLDVEGLKIVSQLSRLEGVNIDGARLGEAESRYLAELPQLRVLELPRCDITDSAIAGLARSKSITNLTLVLTPISDAGIEHLMPMKQLNVVGIDKTRVTEAGFKRLKAALPNCNIAWKNEPSGRIFVSDGWVSLMSIIDPKKDHAGNVGTWVRTEKGFEGSHPQGDNMVRLQLPLTVSNDYELEVEFTRPKDALNAMHFELGVGPNNIIGVALDVGGKAGFALINGVDLDMNGTAKDFLLEHDKRRRALIRVKATTPTASVETDIDGKPLLSWKGKPETLSVNTGNSTQRTVNLCFGPPGAIIIHSVRFRVLEGSATLTRPEDTAKLFEPKKP